MQQLTEEEFNRIVQTTSYWYLDENPCYYINSYTRFLDMLIWLKRHDVDHRVMWMSSFSPDGMDFPTGGIFQVCSKHAWFLLQWA